MRIMRQLITESLLMAMVAGIAGLVMAYWGARVLAALSPFEVVRSAGAGVDVGVLTFTLAVSAATSVIFGLVPALHATKIELADATRQGGTRSIIGGRAVRTRSVLVVSEVALAVVLLTGAGLLTKSLIALDRVALGFQPGNTLVMKATRHAVATGERRVFRQPVREDRDTTRRGGGRRHLHATRRFEHCGFWFAPPRSTAAAIRARSVPRRVHDADDRRAWELCGAGHSVEERP